ncbi:MAG: hypothetical protein WDA22_09010 [Bacteroidota bacterium]
MKAIIPFFLFLVMFGMTITFSQDDRILPAQAEAIRSLALEKGFTAQALNDYLIQKWGSSLNDLSRKNAATLIALFQSDTPPLPSDVIRTAPAQNTPTSTLQPQQQNNPVVQQNSTKGQQQTLLIAEYLEIGMSKRFHLIDGNIIQGSIASIDSGMCNIETADGILKIPTKDILEETAEITKRDGSRYVGPVLKETIEDITVRSKYGDVIVDKRDIQNMNRYHGGKLVPWAEEKKTFYRGNVVLTDIFFDPTAFPLEPNSLYISALSLGYGFTDRFMVRTSFGNNFSGDLNLQPIIQFYNQRTATNRIAAAVGMDMYSHHDMTSVIAKYARFIKEDKVGGKPINELSAPFSISNALSKQYKNNFYAEFYVVLSHRWTLESGRGEMGYHLGFRTNTLPFYRDDVLAAGYKWSNDALGKVPFRFWAAFEYDLMKDLKLAANIWADNGYRYRTLNQVVKDYLRETPFILDGLDGEERTVDFDFGLLYAVNESLRIGIHFQHPYIALFWRIVEF